jgi:pSer/pThr/pTyr-binding forkhead associated (FHA) protein
MSWILQSDENRPTILRLSPGSVKTIGRGTGADFIVDAALVSRIHCRLTAEVSDQLVLEDLDSTNGTMVNGKKMGRAILRPGDTVTIGRRTFTVQQST